MQQPCFKRLVNARGFTLVEVFVAAFILTIGFLASTALTSPPAPPNRRSKYKALASASGSEKLEELTRWDPNDPNVCVPPQSGSVGSLTTDVTQTTTCPGGASDTVSYFDDVTMGTIEGAFSETISSMNGGDPVYVTTYHSADGTVIVSTSEEPPSAPATFHRRWTITKDSRARGGRRVTVRVILLDRSVRPAVTVEIETK